jgi:hypothetical protein
MYTVEDEHGRHHQMQRRFLRHRKWHTIAFIGVTSDKKHDSYATQYFMTEQQKWWQEKYVDRKKEPITSLHVHSDNASHFKSSKSLNFLSRIPMLFVWLLCVTWSFGCGGHGKGPWDGIGAVIKRALRACVVDKKVLSDSGKLKTWVDVLQHLQRRFSTEKWAQEHHTYKHTVNEFVIQGCESVSRPTYEETFEQVFGIQKSFGYLALGSGDGTVMQREWDCWCPACFCSVSAIGRGDHGSCTVPNSTGQGHWVVGCASQEPWFECTAQRKDARGVHVRRKLAQQVGQKLAVKLKPGDWIAVQDRRTVDPVFPFMIGRAMGADGTSDANQDCIVKTATEKQTINGQRFDAGDSAVAVRLYTRLASDPEGMTFEAAEIGLFNSTELRAIQFKMTQDDAPLLTNDDSDDDDVPLGRLCGLKPHFSLDQQIERAILHECW